MSRIAKLFAANAIAAAGLGIIAVAVSPSAGADPVAPPVVPGVPALSMLQGLASPAGVGTVLQTAATALNGASAMVGAPTASTLPVSPIQGAPATPPVPAPAAAPMGIGSTVVPLLNQIGVPAQLVNLAPQMPLLGNSAAVAPAAAAPITAITPVAPLATAPVAPLAVTPISPVAPAAPAAAAVPAAPLAAAVPGSSGLNPLAMLTALP